MRGGKVLVRVVENAVAQNGVDALVDVGQRAAQRTRINV